MSNETKSFGAESDDNPEKKQSKKFKTEIIGAIQGKLPSEGIMELSNIAKDNGLSVVFEEQSELSVTSREPVKTKLDKDGNMTLLVANDRDLNYSKARTDIAIGLNQMLHLNEASKLSSEDEQLEYFRNNIIDIMEADYDIANANPQTKATEPTVLVTKNNFESVRNNVASQEIAANNYLKTLKELKTDEGQ